MKYRERQRQRELAEIVTASNQLAAERFNPLRLPGDLSEAVAGKTVLVTGGTGSIGREMVRQLLSYRPKVVRVFSRNEFNQYAMAREFGERRDLRFLIGDVRDRERLLRACEDVELLFHAGALKHVPVCEYNPFEAVKTNVIGTQNVVDAALEYNMELVVGVSTDKSVSPTNTMGATKLLGERVLLSASQYKGDRRTRFAVVRFGNVLASRGSVVPLFIEQIRQGGPLTLSHPGMLRFFMSIPQAVGLTLDAAVNSRGGEVFVLKMPVMRIADLIEALIEIYAPRFSRRPQDIAVNIGGIRPGEKLSEALMTPEEAIFAEEREDCYVIRPFAAPDPDRLSGAAHARGYDSDSEKPLTVAEIIELFEREGLVEALLEAPVPQAVSF